MSALSTISILEYLLYITSCSCIVSMAQWLGYLVTSCIAYFVLTDWLLYTYTIFALAQNEVVVVAADITKEFGEERYIATYLLMCVCLSSDINSYGMDTSVFICLRAIWIYCLVSYGPMKCIWKESISMPIRQKNIDNAIYTIYVLPASRSEFNRQAAAGVLQGISFHM